MKNSYVQINLQEAKMQLDEIFDQFESLDEVEFMISMTHLYHHLNTAYNCKGFDENYCFSKTEEDDFYNKMEKFPENLFN